MFQDPHIQKNILLNLKKASGSIQNIIKMIEKQEYCVDIAIQVNATIGLLKSVNTKLLENHLKCCGPNLLTHQDAGKIDVFVKELIRTWDISTRK